LSVGLDVDFVDEIERWVRCTLVDGKTDILFNALHATNRGLYPAIYNIIFLTIPVS
jgi:hypothetical protein